MKNKEKYAKEIAGIPFSELAMTKDGKICRCRELWCRDCFFNTPNFPFCSDEGDLCCENCYNWLEQEAEPEEPTIDELKSELESVKKENAELRARLECSIEFPCKIGDTIYYINPYRAQPKIDEFKVISLCKENFYGKMIFIDNGEFFFAGDKWLFFTYDEAEARLKELQGGENGNVE